MYKYLSGSGREGGVCWEGVGGQGGRENLRSMREICKYFKCRRRRNRGSEGGMREWSVPMGHPYEVLDVVKGFWRGVGRRGLRNKGSLMRKI